jgi:hypothetical protein
MTDSPPKIEPLLIRASAGDGGGVGMANGEARARMVEFSTDL